jgi:hypothetical protein
MPHWYNMGAYLKSADSRVGRIGYLCFSYTRCRCYVRTQDFTGYRIEGPLHASSCCVSTYCLHWRLWEAFTDPRNISVAFHKAPPRFRFKVLSLLGLDVDCPSVALDSSLGLAGSGLWVGCRAILGFDERGKYRFLFWSQYNPGRSRMVTGDT